MPWPSSRASFSSFVSRPAVVGSGIVLLLAGRWIWVAGLGDYGWEYEVASRILRGEVFFRDFLLLRGPLSYYSLALWMHFLGTHLFVYHLHLWFSYALCLGAGLLLVRELGVPRSAQVIGVSLGAVLAVPVFGWGHALQYQATGMAGVAILGTLLARRKGRLWAVLAGVAAAASIYHKQNIGIALAICIPLFLRGRSLLVYLGAFSFVFLAIFACFASKAGVEEVWRQLFTDAASTKGGGILIVARAVPRLIFPPELPHRRIWELAATCVVYVAMFPLVWRLIRRQSLGVNEGDSSAQIGSVCLVACVLAVAASLVHLDGPLPEKALGQLWMSVLQLTYILFFLLCAVYFLRHPEPGWAGALFLVLAVTAAQEASNPNFVISAPLVVPLIIGLLARHAVVLGPKTVGPILAGVYLLGTTTVGPVAFYGLCAYQPTFALPAGSPFAGLRAPDSYARKVREIWLEVRPLIAGRTTLWLVGGGGPYLAYGGTSVFNAPYYMPDSFPVRLDAQMIRRWEADPPQAVVLQDHFHASLKSELLTAGYIKTHVLGRYAEVWRGKNNAALGLWLRQSSLMNP